MSHARFLCAALILVLLTGPRTVLGAPELPPVPPALIGLARADHLYLPGPVYAPPGVYPEGKIDWEVIHALVRQSAETAGIPSPWKSLFEPTDRVGVMIDTTPPAVPMVTVDAVLEQLVRAGLSPDRLFIFSAEETGLFAAGFSLKSEGQGVKCYGADRMGYRGGLSRLVLDTCDKIVNLAVLRPSPVFGMTGCLHNYLNAVDHTTRAAIQAQPDTLGSVALNRQLQNRMVLHFLDCTHPFYAPVGSPDTEVPRWEYRGLLCGKDAVAVDVVGQEILEAKRAALNDGQPDPLAPQPTYLRTATEKYRVGESARELIELTAVGDQTEILVHTETP